MCLILFAWQVDRRHPLVVAANRDEFFARPTAPASRWPGTKIVAGRDLLAGGTWLGVAAQGRFAALTNYRDPSSHKSGSPSRGALVADYLAGRESPAEYMAALTKRSDQYSGFNLLVGNETELLYLSNFSPGVHALPPGIYGLSNHLLDTPWPKVVKGKAALAEAMLQLPDTAALFGLLRDDRIATDQSLPQTGIGRDWERVLSAAFVRSPEYGTRSSTVAVCDLDGAFDLTEVSFDSQACPTGTVRVSLAAEASLLR